MNHITICLAFADIQLAAPDKNALAHQELIINALDKKAALLLFPPLSLTGDGLGEFYRQPTILEGSKKALSSLTKLASLPTFIGLPMQLEDRLFSVMALIDQGEIKGYIPLSSKDKAFSDPLLFPKNLYPDKELYKLSIYLDDSFSYPSKNKDVIALFKEESKKTDAPLLYLSCPESYSISGGIHSSSYILWHKEETIATDLWSDELITLEVALEKGSLELFSYKPKKNNNQTFSSTPFLSPNFKGYQELLSHQAKAYGNKLLRTGSSHSIIGISGGLDSTWALIATLQAHRKMNLPLDHIHPIVLPGFGSSEDTMSSALDLLDALALKAEIISIDKAVLQHFEDLGHDPEEKNIVYENAQARERTQILMNLANKYHGLVVGTGDMSEIALGWSTYNGDQMSMYGINAGLPKTLIQDLILWYAKKEGGKLEKALRHILGRPISPELLPPDPKGEILQKTEDLIGKYEIIDFILYYSLQHYPIYQIEKLMAQAFGGVSKKERKEHLARFYKRFINQQFKRTASPHGIKLTHPSLVGFEMASDLNASDFIKEIENL